MAKTEQQKPKQTWWDKEEKRILYDLQKKLTENELVKMDLEFDRCKVQHDEEMKQARQQTALAEKKKFLSLLLKLKECVIWLPVNKKSNYYKSKLLEKFEAEIKKLEQEKV